MPKQSGLYKSINGTLLEPFVLKFVSDSTHLNEFISNDYKFSYFRGQMEVHKFTDYFQTGLGLKTDATSCAPAFDAFGDPIPCEVVGFQGAGTSSGGNSISISPGGVSTSGGSGGSSGGGSSCSWNVTYLPCGCGGNADGHGPSGVSCCNGSPVILTIVCPPSFKMPTANKTTSTINPCPDCPNGNSGGVGVSLSDTALNNIISNLQLGAADKVLLTWLKLEATPTELLAMNKFLEDNFNSEETQAFLREAIKALMNNGEVDWVNKIIIDNSFKDNPCLNTVYLNLRKVSTFNNYLKNFDTEFSVANLKLSTNSNLASSINAQTIEPINYLIEIHFNINNLNRPPLDIARTMIHELIHAEIFRKLLSLAKQNKISWTENFIISIKDDYPGLYDYYLRYEFNVPVGSNPSSAQHELMAQHYRYIIEQVLRDYDNTQTAQIYTALAWSGLKNTVAWTNLSQQQKDDTNFYREYFLNNNTNCQ